MTCRSCCFTIFDMEWKHEVLSKPEFKCGIVQKEKCPDTGREHFQGFVQLVKVSRYSAIKSLLECDSAHLEKAKGSPQQAWAYCEKEDSRIDGPWMYGTRPGGAGKR